SGQWDQVLAAAKREAALTVYGQAGTGVADALTQQCKQKYPDIKVNFTGGNGNELVTKLLTERQAGRFDVDLMIQGPPNLLDLASAGALEPLPPLLVGPDEDASKWADQQLHFADDAGKYVLAMLGGIGMVGIYNPKLVSGSDFTSYKDLLNPKLKGKLAMLDPRLPGSAQAAAQFWYDAPQLGKDFIQQLIAQDVAVTKDDRQLTDWVARGEYAMGIGANGFAAVDLKKEGVDIEFLPAQQMKEGGHMTSSWGSVAMLGKASHPNAAKVYLNGLLSKEGQEALVGASGYPSRRSDASTDGIFGSTVPQKGVQYIEINQERYVKQRPEIVSYLKSLLGS